MQVETYTSVVVSVALLLVAPGLVRTSSSRGDRARYRHVGAGLPPARHRIAGHGPGPGQVREVPERELSEA